MMFYYEFILADADIAQLVERILGKDEVTGSNPVISSKRKPRSLGEILGCVVLLLLLYYYLCSQLESTVFVRFKILHM